jgi:glycosyltransferase involved in cell wall biosynthesis
VKPAVAFVVQRYGPEIAGGSESLARALAERLGELEITVFTTCARDYVTWRNELPAGSRQENGVEVRRFPVEEERDLASFNELSDAIYGRPHTAEDEEHWLRRQGPHVPALVAALAAEAERFAAVVFFTYLYYPTVAGLRVAGKRSLLVPTAHDEPALRLAVFEEVFRRPAAFAFLTAAEQEVVRARFDLRGRPALVAGIGLDPPAVPDVAGFRARHRVTGRYVLYAGRIDAGKGCAQMLDFHASARRGRADGPDLLLAGRLAMDEPRRPGVRYLGYLAEEEKQAALAGAEAVICPSPFESLSIVLLEGFAHGVPGLVNARSTVLKDHCVHANAGLFYEDADEFAAALWRLHDDEALRLALGANGRRYAAEGFGWEAVLARYRSLIRAAAEQGRD